MALSPTTKSWSFISEESFAMMSEGECGQDSVCSDGTDTDASSWEYEATSLENMHTKSRVRKHSSNSFHGDSNDGHHSRRNGHGFANTMHGGMCTASHDDGARLNIGSTFFNYTLYGSLRHGADVNLFSFQYAGLAVTAFACGFVEVFYRDCFVPLLMVYLNYERDRTKAVSNLLWIPGVTSFFFGICSDLYPFCGFHRKAYLVAGWIIAYVMYMVLVVICMVDSRSDFSKVDSGLRTMGNGIVYIILSMLACFGEIMASLSGMTMTVELSQREPIHERGTLMLKYLLCFLVGSEVASIATAMILDPSETEVVKNHLSMKVILLICALCSLIPILMALFCLYEERRDPKPLDQVSRFALLKGLGKVLEQKAVYRIILYIVAALFCENFAFPGVTRALRMWTGFTPKMKLVLPIPNQLIQLIFVVLYQKFMLNYSWVRVCLAALALRLTLDFAQTIPVIFGVIRNAWYLLVLQSLMGLVTAVSRVIRVVPLLEIAEPGYEGATVGLVMSYTYLVSSVVPTFCAMVDSSNTLNGSLAVANLRQDLPKTRTKVLVFSLVTFVVVALGFLPIFYLLPEQKLDAQQMRTYGGTNRQAAMIIALLFVACLMYTVVSNAVGFV